MLHHLTHSCLQDLDILLVAPDDTSIVLMSDVGGCPGVESTRTLTFSDLGFPAAVDSVPGDGSILAPTDAVGGWADSYPYPAPTGTFVSNLAAFKGKSSQGWWRLFVVDDNTGNRGEILAWTLVLKVVHTFSNTAQIALPPGGGSNVGAGSPYPSTVLVHGVTGRIDRVRPWVQLQHEDPDDVDLLLVGPGGQQALLMSDAGGYGDMPFPGVILTFDDASGASLPDSGPLVAGTYRPTDHAPADAFAAPAPPGPYPASLAVFKDTAPNLTWSLYAVDDATAGAGLIPQWGMSIVAVRSLAAPTLDLIGPQTITADGPFQAVPVKVGDATDALVTWRNATNGATGLARSAGGTYYTALVPVVAGSNGVTLTLTNAAGEQVSRFVTIQASSFTYTFSEGATGPFFDTCLLVTNLSTATQPILFTYRTSAGTVVNKVRIVAPVSRLTVNIEHEDPLLADTAVSTTVLAPVPIVAERAMYWPGEAPTWHGVHNSFGLVDTGSRWGVADGRVGGPEGFETYILVVNPEPVEASLVMTFSRLGLPAPVVKYAVVPANSRLNVTLATHAPEVLDPSGATEFSTTIEATNLTRIAVERATYWNSGGTTWAGGANVPATRLR